jgi:CBS domain-containing protein
MAQSVQNVTASDIMTRRLVTLDAEMDVFKAIDLIGKSKISGAPVIDKNGLLLGMFTEKSCLEVLVDAAYEGLPTNQVGAFMDDPVHTINENTKMLEMAQIFLNKRTRRLPVVNEGKLVGQVSRRDVIGAANRIIKKTSGKSSTLLYLSALREMEDAPVT